MDKRILIFALVLVLGNQAYGEISQEAAGKICESYGSPGETTAVSGPLLCDGVFWICNYDYYGKKQSVFIAVNVYTSEVMNPINNRAQIESIGSTKFLLDYGGQYIFTVPLLDSSFIIDLSGMNATFQNYGKIIDAVREKGIIDANTQNNLTLQIDNLKEKSSQISLNLTRLFNISREFTRNPGCDLDIDLLEGLQESGTALKKYTEDWGVFIQGFNSKIASISAPGLVIPSLNPADVQVVLQGIQDTKATIEGYLDSKKDFVSKAVGNIQTRILRKEAKDMLDEAQEKVEESKSQEARDKYNEAANAYNEGDYALAEILSREAISLALSSGNGDGEPVIIVETPPDYTSYFVLIAILLGLLVLLVFLRRGKKTEEDEEESEKEKKLKKKGGWMWTKEKESSMEKSAKRSKSLEI